MALKTAEHRVSSSGIVSHNRSVQLLEGVGKHHVIGIQDKSIRRTRELQANVPRIGQPGI